MRAKINFALGWLEKVAAIVNVVVPATRAVVSLLEPEKVEKLH